MVTRFGMDEELGVVSYEADRPTMLGGAELHSYLERQYSEVTAQRIDAGVKRVIDRALERALVILRANRRVLEEGARKLLEAETLEEDALRELAQRLAAQTPTEPRMVEAA
jgi:cell division protease FtsH